MALPLLNRQSFSLEIRQSLFSKNCLRMVLALAVVFCITIVSSSSTMAQQVKLSQIRLEIGMARGVPVGVAHSWSRRLSKIGLTKVRLAQVSPNGKIEVKQTGTGAVARYTVYCVLNQRNVLITSGGKFSLQNTAGLTTWLKTIGQSKDHQKKENDKKPTAFGLTKKQLEQLSTLLSPAYAASTQGASAKGIIQSIERKLGGTLIIDPQVEKLIAADDKVRDELKGLSYGTTLAAILRPMGLVLIPRPTPAGSFNIVITGSRGAKAIWPIGWPRTKAPAKHLPAIGKATRIQSVEAIPLSDALAAVTSRLKVPVLFDHNSMLRKQIDPTKIMVKMKPGRLGYSTILRSILAKGKLKYEMRLDENEKPFLWITTR